MSDQRAGSVTIPSWLLLRRVPALVPGEGEMKALFLYFQIVQWEQRGQRGTEGWRTGGLWGEGKGCLITAATYL